MNIPRSAFRFDSRDRPRIRSDAANTPPSRRKGPLVGSRGRGGRLGSFLRCGVDGSGPAAGRMSQLMLTGAR